jgi:hypothetical protein
MVAGVDGTVISILIKGLPRMVTRQTNPRTIRTRVTRLAITRISLILSLVIKVDIIEEAMAAHVAVPSTGPIDVHRDLA